MFIARGNATRAGRISVRQPRVLMIARADNNRPAFIHRYLKAAVNYAGDDYCVPTCLFANSPRRRKMRADVSHAVKIALTKGAFHLVTQVDTSIILSLLFMECKEK